MSAELNFVRQQGFKDATPEACVHRYPALMLQPRAIGALVALGVVLQLATYFLVLCALLWWCAAWEALNPFDAMYNRVVAKPRGLPPLGPAPGPRRFAQAVGGALMLAIALSLLAGKESLAWVFESLLVLALVALIFGRLCVGSYLFHLFRGQVGYANRTMPWSRGVGDRERG